MRWVDLTIVVVFIAVIVIFVVENIGVVTMAFLGFSLHAPLASSRPHHRTLPELSQRTAVKALGEHGAADYPVGLYCLVSVTLNGFDVPLPESEPV